MMTTTRFISVRSFRLASAVLCLVLLASGIGNLTVTEASIPRVGIHPLMFQSPANGTNVALASNGGVASASSTYSASYPASSINDGDRKGTNWGSGGGWNDGTQSAYPDWVQVDFNGSKTINEIDVFTLQDNYTNPVEPTPTMIFTTYGVLDFEAQYWDGANWVDVPGGNITANTLVWRQIYFGSSVTTSKIRILVNNAQLFYSRIVEVEAHLAPVDLALNQSATQSSTFVNGGVTFDASRAVDGNTNGDFWGAQSSATTNYGAQNWWQVDLGSSQSIGTIQVWPRTDCCPEHLANFYVFVSDQPFVSTDLTATLNQSGVSNYYTNGFSGTPTTINVNRTGRYVRVQRSDSQYLVIAEVQVWNGPPPLSSTGQWSSLMDWTTIPGQVTSPIFEKPVAVHANVLPNGKVLIFSRDGDAGGNDLTGSTPGARFYDPRTNAFTVVPNSRTLMFCSGHTLLPDGKLLVAGGHHGQNSWGEPQTNVFDFTTNTWSSSAPDMGPDFSYGRWYPTAVTLGNGDALVYSGQYCSSVNGAACAGFSINKYPQVWHTASSTWSPRLNFQPDGTVQLYPWMHVAPNGQVFITGPDSYTHYFDPNGNAGSGAWTAGPRQGCDPCFRTYGTSVMYDSGKVLVVGGDDPPRKTSEIINLNASTPAWTSTTGTMAYARRQLNATVLADGTVLASGGSSGAGFDDSAHPVLPAELWNPVSGLWTTMASLSTYRGYHSTAVLLPDGRVLSAGGGQLSQSPPASPSAEIYSPPYLFKGPRPKITSGPESATYNQVLFFETPDAAAISKVTLVRLSSTTHAFNMGQRFMQLSFTQNVDHTGLWVSAPANGNAAPPGHYMLFILNSSGVPSVAKIISIGSTNPVTTENVVWTNPAGVSISGNSVSKSAGTANWDAAAQSTRAIAYGDGYVEATASETNTYRMFGLTHGHTTNSYTDIDFAVYLTAENAVHIFEGGSRVAIFGGYAAGDRFRVAIEDGVVKYSKNGVVFYSHAANPTYPLLVDTSFYSPGATITNAVVSGVLR